MSRERTMSLHILNRCLYDFENWKLKFVFNKIEVEIQTKFYQSPK